MIYRSHGAFTPHSEFHFVFSLFRSITPVWHSHKGYVFLVCDIGGLLDQISLVKGLVLLVLKD